MGSWLAQTAQAGPYADTLSKCLVDSTSKKDRTELVRWMFSAASLHPAVKPISNLTDEQLDAANRDVAGLFMRLLTESCEAETKQALQFEGNSTIEVSFSVLGQVAGQELFSSPEVAAGLSGLDKYMDNDRLAELQNSD